VVAISLPKLRDRLTTAMWLSACCGFPWRAQRRHHGSEAAVHRADDLGLIVDRYDYREDRPAARLHVHWR